MNQKIAELKEYIKLEKELSETIEALKDEIKAEMQKAGIDEIVTAAGKCTWRETIASRFDATAFKKDFGDIYREYTRETVYKRFTVN